MKKHLYFFIIGFITPAIMGLSLLITLPIIFWCNKHGLLFLYLGITATVSISVTATIYFKPHLLEKYMPKILKVTDKTLAYSYANGLGLAVGLCIVYLLQQPYPLFQIFNF